MGDTTREDPPGFAAPLPSSGPMTVRRLGGYELLEELGRGGMGAVYRARHTSGREVALKVLLVLDDPELLERFKVEGQAAARLKHPNVIVAHELGWDAGRPFLVMELVRGASLQSLLRGGPLLTSRAVEIVLQLAEGVAHAHDHGVLHRDLTPGNVMLRDVDGRPLLTDFGLARLKSMAQRLTQTGTSMGTPNYMSPEQARGDDGDERVDIYGLGAVLYTLLTGQPPFPGTSPLLVMDAVVSQAPTPPSHLREGLDRGLEEICLRCLEKRPEDRFPTAQALVQALREHQARGVAPARVGWVSAAAGALLGALVLGIGAVLLLGQRPPTEAPREGVSDTAAVDSSPVSAPVDLAPVAIEPVGGPLAHVAAVGPDPEDVRRSESRLDSIEAAVQRRELDLPQALELVERVLADAPYHGRAYFLAGVLRAQQGGDQRALADLRRADQVAIPYEDSTLHRERGLLARRLGQDQVALPDLERAFKAAPSDLQVGLQLGVAYRHTGRDEEAVPVLEAVERLRPDQWQTPFNLAGALQSLQRYDASIAAYERAHAAAKGAVLWPLLRLSDSLIAQGRYEEAEVCVRRLSQEVHMRSADDYSLVDAQMARVFLERGDLEQALEFGERGMQRALTDRAITVVARCYETLGRRGEGVALIERHLQQGVARTPMMVDTLRRLREELEGE